MVSSEVCFLEFGTELVICTFHTIQHKFLAHLPGNQQLKITWKPQNTSLKWNHCLCMWMLILLCFPGNFPFSTIILLLFLAPSFTHGRHSKFPIKQCQWLMRIQSRVHYATLVGDTMHSTLQPANRTKLKLQNFL